MRYHAESLLSVAHFLFVLSKTVAPWLFLENFTVIDITRSLSYCQCFSIGWLASTTRFKYPSCAQNLLCESENVSSGLSEVAESQSLRKVRGSFANLCVPGKVLQRLYGEVYFVFNVFALLRQPKTWFEQALWFLYLSLV